MPKRGQKCQHGQPHSTEQTEKESVRASLNFTPWNFRGVLEKEMQILRSLFMTRDEIENNDVTPEYFDDLSMSKDLERPTNVPWASQV